MKDDTLRYNVRKLAKHESIERSKVKRGRHCNVTKEGAGILYSLFSDNNVSSDKQAVMELSKREIHVSCRTISRLLANGFMEKMGYHSLTMQRVCFRGENAESPETRRQEPKQRGFCTSIRARTIIQCSLTRRIRALDEYGSVKETELGVKGFGEEKETQRHFHNDDNGVWSGVHSEFGG